MTELERAFFSTIGTVIATAESSAPVATTAAEEVAVLCMVGAKARNWTEGAIFTCCADKSEVLDEGQFDGFWSRGRLWCRFQAFLCKSSSNNYRPNEQEGGSRVYLAARKLCGVADLSDVGDAVERTTSQDEDS